MVEEKRQQRHRSSDDLNLSIPLRSFSQEQARTVVGQVRDWQRRFRRERGRTFVYLGDEFYLLADLPFPGRRHYDGFPQLEDGIGLTRLLIDDVTRLRRRLAYLNVRGRTATLACGVLIAPVMERLVAEINALAGCDLRVLPVPNDFFGRTITVSGLLTGRDVASAVLGAGPEAPGPLFLPQSMLSQRYGNFLDDMTPAQLAEQIGRPVLFAQQISSVVRLLAEGSDTTSTYAQEEVLAGRHASRNDK
jgi:NifB/MoaA-like Fe-S oxidoreductase